MVRQLQGVEVEFYAPRHTVCIELWLELALGSIGLKWVNLWCGLVVHSDSVVVAQRVLHSELKLV